jgi:pyruvate,water dikinase
MTSDESAAKTRFPNPFEVPIPAACEGWEDMYAYHAVFADGRRTADEDRFWFQNGLHSPEPVCPFDSVWMDCSVVALNQSNARLFVVPPSLGVEYRVLNGYIYLSGNSITDAETVRRRAELFARRGGFYYAHWDALYERWVDKVETATRELVELEVPSLPEFEDEAVVTEGRGVGTSHALLVAYDRMLEGLDRILQYHFEFNNLGYGAYLAFHEFCQEVFPGISGQAVAKMVSGIDVLVLRPDEELRRLALRARELGVADAVKLAVDECELRASLDGIGGGVEWLADFDDTKTSWFWFSFGNGLYHHHRTWNDDTSAPIARIGSYIERLEAGEDIARPSEAIAAERERITEEYRLLVPLERRQEFDERLTLCRTVFPFIENHNFYIEHRYFGLFWNKVREFGGLLAREQFLDGSEDVFYLRHDEVRQALEELRLVWGSAGAGAPRGPGYWPPIVARRKAIYEAMREWTPPPALGRMPGEITEPSMIMLWGITNERVGSWLDSSQESGVVSGIGGSPGVAEGPARVVLSARQIDELKPGEILVAPSTSPSWTPVFGIIAAAVLDTGGTMCHASIIAREYGLPAIVGTGTATRRIKTGDLLRVDAHRGCVTIL